MIDLSMEKDFLRRAESLKSQSKILEEEAERLILKKALPVVYELLHSQESKEPDVVDKDVRDLAYTFVVENIPEGWVRNHLTQHALHGYNCPRVTIETYGSYIGIQVNGIQQGLAYHDGSLCSLKLAQDSLKPLLGSYATTTEELVKSVTQFLKGIYVVDGTIVSNYTGYKLGYIIRRYVKDSNKSEWYRVVNSNSLLSEINYVPKIEQATIFELPNQANKLAVQCSGHCAQRKEFL